MRRYCSKDLLADCEEGEVQTDASPWGIGGTLTVAGVIREYFFDCLHPEDIRRFGYAVGDCAGQQCWESLSIMVALRLWGPALQAMRYSIKVKSDSVVGLVMAGKLKARGPATNQIAREVAMDIGASLYEPRLLEHTPGIANTVPDSLSRLFEPKVAKSHLPDACLRARHRQVPKRGPGYYVASVLTRNPGKRKR